MASRENFVYDQAGNFLFTIQANSIPVEGHFIEHIPLSGPMVKYRVQDVTIELRETLYSPGPPDPDRKGWTPRVRIEVEVVP